MFTSTGAGGADRLDEAICARRVETSVRKAFSSSCIPRTYDQSLSTWLASLELTSSPSGPLRADMLWVLEWLCEGVCLAAACKPNRPSGEVIPGGGGSWGTPGCGRGRPSVGAWFDD